jgi:hypothetical protein
MKFAVPGDAVDDVIVLALSFSSRAINFVQRLALPAPAV